MKLITWVGVFIAVLGAIGLAIPVFTTSQTSQVWGTLRFRAPSNPRT